jgi:LacI family transcriptional regulator
MNTAPTSKPRISDIALHAGVGTATVDRVMNNRPGVKPATVARVLEAARWLEESGARPKVQATAPAGLTLRVLLGGSPGFANEILMLEFRAAGREFGMRIRADFVRRTDIGAQCAALDECLENGVSGVILQPAEHPSLRDAVQRLLHRGIPVITVLTSLPGIEGLGYVGLDNRSAGRAAGQLLGLLCEKKGDVAVFYTDSLYRSLEEREGGLRSLLREDFANVRLVESISTFDVPETCYRLTRELLSRRPDLSGICNLGAGNRGIERALLDTGKARKVSYVAFNLTPLSRKALIEGTMHAVIHQDMGRIARSCLQMTIDRLSGQPARQHLIPAEVILRENIRDIGAGA